MKKREDLIYPELSYQLVGIMYDVHNELGGGLREKTYEKAIIRAFEEKKIEFKNQFPIDVIYRGEKVAKRYFDFLIEDKIVLEIKTGSYFKKESLKQIYEYLKSANLKLGIIVNFGKDKVKFSRILNIK